MDKQRILNRVSKALDSQFEMYTWEDMIDDCDLTADEKKWALENIGYRAYIDE